MGPRFYVDTSVYLCILLGESGSAALARDLRGGALVSSVLLVLETRRNLVRIARQGKLSAAQMQAALDRSTEDFRQFSLRDLTFDLCTAVQMPALSTPRSLDLAHLRTALWFHDEAPLARFVTLDDAQAIAARELGLPA
ncbi:MAG: PIN domain-containing protein [Deltaproteobacteria bacterium]|nr:PIN domain-containing protein [Deltaproteobacteria bacterium]